MKRKISLLLILVLMLSSIPVFASSEATISISLNKKEAKVGDTVKATVSVKDINVFAMTLPIHFNSGVVKVANYKGEVVANGKKNHGDMDNYIVGIKEEEGMKPGFWNGTFLHNEIAEGYPYLDNENGLYKLMLSQAMEDVKIVNEDLFTINFLVVGEGDPDIRFASKDRNDEIDPTAPNGPIYFNREVETAQKINLGKIDSLTIKGEGGKPDLNPNPSPGPGGGVGGGGSGKPPTITLTPEINTEEEELEYKISEEEYNNAINKAALGTGSSMNIHLKTNDNIKDFRIKIPIPSVKKAVDNIIITTYVDTPIGLIGFNNEEVLSKAKANSEYVVLDLKDNLTSSISIDKSEIVGAYIGFYTEDMSAVVVGDSPIMKSQHNGKVIIIKTNKNGSYKLEIPTRSFSDLKDDYWATPFIKSLVRKDILDGMSDGRFLPSENVTREQFAKMLVEALEIYDENAAANYTDMKSSDWFYKYVASAEKAGLITGYEDGSFGVGKNITREEMAVMVERSGLKFPINKLPNKFTDQEKISDWSKEAISRMQMAEIINGMPDGSFGPQNNATRAEAARIIYGMLGVLD